MALKRFKPALADCQQAAGLQADAPSVKTLTRLARCQLSTGSTAPALSTLRAVLELEPRNAPALQLQKKVLELEAHLRVELHGAPLPRQYSPPPLLIAPPSSANQSTVYHAPNDDPLIYWGYLVKNRFMAGELYALSHSLVDWVATDPTVQDHVRGAEDQITAFWIKWHPRSQDVRWVRERCWIYDHPKSGTV